jgi:hypothetical protein
MFFLSFLAARFSARVFKGFFFSERFASCDLDMVGSWNRYIIIGNMPV